MSYDNNKYILYFRIYYEGAEVECEFQCPRRDILFWTLYGPFYFFRFIIYTGMFSIRMHELCLILTDWQPSPIEIVWFTWCVKPTYDQHLGQKRSLRLHTNLTPRKDPKHFGRTDALACVKENYSPI